MKLFAALERALLARWRKIKAQGVKYFTDALSISAQDQIRLRKAEEWEYTLQEFIDNPQASANHLVMGYSLDERRECQGLDDYNDHYNWR